MTGREQTPDQLKIKAVSYIGENSKNHSQDNSAYLKHNSETLSQNRIESDDEMAYSRKNYDINCISKKIQCCDEDDLDAKEATQFVKHDFTLKKHPLTFKSLLKFSIKTAVGIIALTFHIIIITIVCVAINITPMPKPYKNICNNCLKSYIGHVFNAVFGLWFYKKFYVSVDLRIVKLFDKLKSMNESPCLLTISNHVSEMDWIYLSKILINFDLYKYTIILIKKELEKVPIIGYLMGSIGHVFIDRNRTKDPHERSSDMASVNKFGKSIFESHLNNRTSGILFFDKIFSFLKKIKFARSTPAANGLFFPEGTTFEKGTYETTKSFYLNALKTPEDYPDLFKPNYVLLPRPMGACALLTKLSDHIDCILDATLLNCPYVSSTFNCYSYTDIFLCRAPPFSFGILLDYVEIPKEIKKSIKNLGAEDNNFEYPQRLTDNEKEVKMKVVKFLNNIYKKKDLIIQEYVEGEYDKEFKDTLAFSEFTKKAYLNSNRKTYSLKLHSNISIVILSTPFLAFVVLLFLIIK